MTVLVVDCQATAAAPRGRLLEIGWALSDRSTAQPHARLIALPDGERIPPAVARITGITEHLLRKAIDARLAWNELIDHAARLGRPAPTIIHYARFEQPFFRALAGGDPPLDIVCTHEIARRLLPDLPRRSLRALTGYFGRGVGTLRRSADHVSATAFVWRELVRLLEDEGVTTWSALRDWLATPAGRPNRAHRVWPMPRDVRLALPNAPGVYRMLRTSGDVLYVGKASSLHHRVNSYFRKQHGIHERLLEMLSQARGISFERTPTPLEAALLEADEIKRHRPPYNIALTLGDRAMSFAARDLSSRGSHPSARCPLGPFPSAETLDQFAALAEGRREALTTGRWGPGAAVFDAGYARFRAAHPELSRDDHRPHLRLLRLGTRLWQEGRRDRDGDEDERIDSWTPELVQLALEWLTLRAALARRRAIWLTRLMDAAVVWSEPDAAMDARIIVIDTGEIVTRTGAAPVMAPPVPPGHLRSTSSRRKALTVPRFDRLRVLTTELKRLVAVGAPVAVRFDAAPPLAGARLGAVLSWL